MHNEIEKIMLEMVEENRNRRQRIKRENLVVYCSLLFTIIMLTGAIFERIS
jgi:hypothetical protein